MDRATAAEAAPLIETLDAELANRIRQVADDPFANPVLLFARDLAARLGRGEVQLAELTAGVRELGVRAFSDRAERLGAYLGRPDPERDRAALETLFEGLAEAGLEAYAAALARPRYGAVFTGHPTFILERQLSLALVELACGRDREGRPLDEADRSGRLALARALPPRPPSPLTIDVEHDWSTAALENAADALDLARRAALAVGRRRWPERWRELTPRLATLATWVGFDTDGRTDIDWTVSLQKRLDLKRRALMRCRRALGPAPGGAAADAAAMLDGALGIVADQLALAAAAREDSREAPAFARALVQGRDEALVDPAPLAATLDRALAEAEDHETAERLAAQRAAVATQGLSLARVHVRLNASQLHRAIADEIRLPGEPTDPANRRAWFAAGDARIAAATPVAISFGSLVAEPAPAKRLMMLLAQTGKYVDAANPTRFLIAEVESGFTVLAALYYARLFGVEDRIEISPLFETEGGLARGEAVFEEALKSPAYRAHLTRQGRFCVEFGFSDSGRFIGQMAATFRIERMQLRLAELMAREGLTGLEAVLFPTHGESIGRGGHPLTLADRLRYVAPPRSRAEFLERGIAVCEETSFQGGEGYLPFFTPAAALATIRGCLEFAYAPEPEGAPGADPIYRAPEFASDFFATIQQAFSDLVEDPDYATLLGLFGTRLLPRTGSRPEQRQGDAGPGVRAIRDVRELRAIPNNGVLQQLGCLANTLFGVGLAAEKDRADFDAMLAGSPRFRRALQLVQAALGLSSLDAVLAYAALFDPALWLTCRTGAGEAPRRAFEALQRIVEHARLHEPLERVLRRIQAEHQRLAPLFDLPDHSPRRRRLVLLHAIRAAVLQRIARIAADLPAFNPQNAVSREAVQEQILRLDIPAAVATLSDLYPLVEADALADADWGEPAAYRAEVGHGHAREHAELFQPLLALHALVLDVSAAVDHEVGACG